MKDKFKKAYMKTAEVFAELSHARRLKVGAVVVKDNRVISIGYNGMPAGWDNNCEDKVYATEWLIDNDTWDYQEEDTGHPYNLKTKPEVLHAEANAVTKLAKSTESGDGAVLFVTHSPCIECSKLIYQSGIRSVFYRDSYRDTKGIEFLKKSGVEVEQLTNV
jgi:dCMP deaminase